MTTAFAFGPNYPPTHLTPRAQGLGDDDAAESSSATLVQTEEGFEPVFFETRWVQDTWEGGGGSAVGSSSSATPLQAEEGFEPVCLEPRLPPPPLRAFHLQSPLCYCSCRC